MNILKIIFLVMVLLTFLGWLSKLMSGHTVGYFIFGTRVFFYRKYAIFFRKYYAADIEGFRIGRTITRNEYNLAITLKHIKEKEFKKVDKASDDFLKKINKKIEKEESTE